jgi:hypothetical protein
VNDYIIGYPPFFVVSTNDVLGFSGVSRFREKRSKKITADEWVPLQP